MENGVASANGEGFLSRMALNDNKAGMEGLDRDKINKIIMESSKGSRFYENELKREQQVNQRIEKILLQKSKVTEQQLKKAQAQVERMASELEKSRDLSRLIVHVDMDAFYAAVEMRDCPELTDKPMAVGSMSMLSTSNYHARKYGVRAGMPGFIAKKLCPNLVIVPTNFGKYRAVSTEIREIFADYDPHFQPMSLDEAYLDFTDHLEQRKSWPESSRTHHFHASSTATGEEQESVSEVKDLSPVLFDDSPISPSGLPDSESVSTAGVASEVFGTSVEEAVREMRFRIEQKTMLTASAGIAPNMMLAKVCSDKNKPNGQYRLPSTREAVRDFTQNLPVRKVSGIGKVSEKMLNALGISSCSHLGQQMALLSVLFSEVSWHHFMQVSLGLGSTHIERHEERKSMSTERTFKELNRADEQLSLCRELCEDLAGDMKREDLKGKTVTLKLKNVNFEVKSRAVTLPYAVATVDEIFAAAKDLLKTEIENESPQLLRLRLMGVRISAFVSLDDKKSLQKSIIGFLQAGKTDSSGASLEMHQRTEAEQLTSCPPPAQKCVTQEEVPWQVKKRGLQGGHMGEEPQQSFFNRAHAKRLQAVSASTQEEGNGETASVILSTDTHDHKTEGSSTSGDKPKSNCTAAGLPKIDKVSLSDAQASTSGCGGTVSSSLTCPVCFRQVKTDDLNVFNTHIDQCLSNVSREPNQCTLSDSGSDLDMENEHKEYEVMDKCRGEIETQVQQEKMKNTVNLEKGSTRLNPPPDQGNLTNDSIQAALSINGDGGTVTSQQPQSCNVKGPTLVCPVCQLTQDTDDLIIFNCHVDLCLNQDVLHELGRPTSSAVNPPSVAFTNSKAIDSSLLLPRQASKGKTKRRLSPSSLPSKKAKGVGPHNTIDKFFR